MLPVRLTLIEMKLFVLDPKSNCDDVLFAIVRGGRVRPVPFKEAVTVMPKPVLLKRVTLSRLGRTAVGGRARPGQAELGRGDPSRDVVLQVGEELPLECPPRG